MVQNTERPGGCRPSNPCPVVSCAAAISVPMHRIRAKDLWSGVLLAELRFLDLYHVYSVALQDVCKLVVFCS